MSSHETSTLEARPLLTGLVIGESPRWHEDRLWFANWGTEEIVAVDLEGNAEVVGKGSPGLGWSIDWLRDGRILVTGQGLIRREPDGSMVGHADLSGLGVNGFNEIVVDGRGNIYVNGGCDFEPGEGKPPGIIALVTRDGSVRRVADGIAFPNGMAVTPDCSTLIIAELRREADGVRHRRRRRPLSPARLGRRRWPGRDLRGRQGCDLDGCPGGSATTRR